LWRYPSGADLVPQRGQVVGEAKVPVRLDAGGARAVGGLPAGGGIGRGPGRDLALRRLRRLALARLLGLHRSGRTTTLAPGVYRFMRAGLGRALGASSTGVSGDGKLRSGASRISRARVCGPSPPATAYSLGGLSLIQRALSAAMWTTHAQ